MKKKYSVHGNFESLSKKWDKENVRDERKSPVSVKKKVNKYYRNNEK